MQHPRDRRGVAEAVRALGGGAASSRPCDQPEPPEPARHRAESRHLPAAGGGREPDVRVGSRDRGQGVRGDGAGVRSSLPSVRVLRRGGRGGRDRVHGLGRERGPRDGELPERAWQQGGRAEGASVPSVEREALPGGASEDGEARGGAGPVQGPWRAGRAAVPGHVHVVQQPSERDPPDGDRRTVRTGLEGLHAGSGDGGVREPAFGEARGGIHGGHSRRLCGAWAPTERCRCRRRS